MAAAGDTPAELLNDIFTVTAVNPDGKKFDKVNRLICKSETYGIDMSIDIASEVYPLKKDEKFAMVLRSTLRLDGKPDDGTYDQSTKESALDAFEYGMSGKIFKYDHAEDARVSIYASYGGLLMLVQGKAEHLKALKLDSRVYCLMRRAASGGM
ncbi:polr2h [Symbiodinium sp. KB8]|nr:polr2h [Symbiodinium sp. KB8]